MWLGTKRYVFNGHVDDLYALTLLVTQDITELVQFDDLLISKVKMVLVELLTNSLKHSGQSQTFIETALWTDKIILTKKDTGEPFSVEVEGARLKWPLTTIAAGASFTIYGDATATLKATLTDACALHFFMEEAQIADADIDIINNLWEHFGLMIITRACHRFQYAYDASSGTNEFAATFLTNTDK